RSGPLQRRRRREVRRNPDARVAAVVASDRRRPLMLFNSYVFLFVFLPIVYVVFWMLPRASWRYVWLAVTGYVFYGYWNPWFCLLMAFSTLVSYFAGLGFLTFQGPVARRVCLVLPITVDLLLLGFFKYAQFGLATVQAMLDWCGAGWILPTEIF